MKANNYCIYGASGHAKVIIEILEASGHTISFLVEDNPAKTDLLGYTVSDSKAINENAEAQWIIGIGSNEVRKKLSEKLKLNFGIAVHPNTNVSKRAVIGAGTVVMPGVSINASTTIGTHVIINTNASVDHDCIIGDFVHISPNASLCGGITVGEGTHIGAGATIIPGIKIGKWAKVGAGAVIIRDVPDYATVVGNPGKIIKTL